MARCGCSSDCACSVQAGDSARVTGSGAPATPYVVSVVVDPAVDNILESGSDGLKVVLPEPAIFVEDTDCVTLDGNGTGADPVRASPVLDPDPNNGLSCGINGLMSSPVGNALFNVQEVNATGNLDYGWLALADSSGGSITLTLPSSGLMIGSSIIVKKVVAANSVIIHGFLAEDIDGANTLTLTSQWSSAMLVCAGIYWVLVGSV